MKLKFKHNTWLGWLIGALGFEAITLIKWCYVASGCKLSPQSENHEAIHTRQWLELWVVGFALYPLEWLFRLLQYRNADKAYRSISFEREAYANENNLNYLNTRKRFAWVKYLKIK